MFKKILVAVDGSEQADAAARQAVELAHAVGASLVAVHVAPPFHMQYFEDCVPPPETTRDIWQAGMRQAAQRHFLPVKQAARDRAVPLVTDVVFDDRPAEAISAAAKNNACDLIVIGPHGRGGVAGYLLGSVTTRVLGASRIPVLVHRSDRA